MVGLQRSVRSRPCDQQGSEGIAVRYQASVVVGSLCNSHTRRGRSPIHGPPTVNTSLAATAVCHQRAFRPAVEFWHGKAERTGENRVRPLQLTDLDSEHQRFGADTRWSNPRRHRRQYPLSEPAWRSPGIHVEQSINLDGPRRSISAGPFANRRRDDMLAPSNPAGIASETSPRCPLFRKKRLHQTQAHSISSLPPSGGDHRHWSRF